jgi:quercetin dioxygenase-like cupin family protein
MRESPFIIVTHYCTIKRRAPMITVDLDHLELISHAPGRRVSFPLHSAAGAASSAVVMIELDPSGELPLHTDSAEELLVVLDGVAEARIGDEVGRLERHQAALVPAMAPHGLRNVGSDLLRVLGTFSSSTVVATFDEPFEAGGPRVFVIGAPVRMAAMLEEPATV